MLTQLLVWWVLGLVASGCSLLPTRGLSVERVLQRSAGAERILEEATVPTQSKSRAPASTPRLQWPLKQMTVSSPFGIREGSKHQGVDLQSRWGTPIYAAADGVVVYAGNEISGYGDTLVLRHRGNLSTLYAHASTILVKEGDLVTRGQAVGYVGDSGNATGAHLHFEVRRGLEPVDPWASVTIPRRLQ